MAHTERYEKRFGVRAVEMGFVTADQLLEALRIQVEEDLKYDKHRLLGEIFRELGYMTEDQVREVLYKGL